MPTAVNRFIPARLIEEAVDAVISLLRSGFNNALVAVRREYDNDCLKINLEPVPDNKWYDTEIVEPLQPPVGFVLADSSEHDLTAQNTAAQTHRMVCVMLVEDIESARLNRKAWRYGLAAWYALHDMAIEDIKVLVPSIDYSPIYTRRGAGAAGGERMFRKDVSLSLAVEHYERF